MTKKSLFLAAVATCAALAARADVPAKQFEIEKLADGVYGFVWKGLLENPINGNSLFIINDSDVVVVDTSNFPSTARVMLAELRKLTDKPVRYVVNTHWHDDHHGGNFVFREAYPGVEIVAHRGHARRHAHPVLRRSREGPCRHRAVGADHGALDRERQGRLRQADG